LQFLEASVKNLEDSRSAAKRRRQEIERELDERMSIGSKKFEIDG
jgi:hypothetical protein